MDTTRVAAPDAAIRRRARLVAVVAAVGAALVLWAVVELGFGLDLHGPAAGAATEASDVGPAQVLTASLLAALAGWGLLALLERVTARARGLWAVIAVVVLIRLLYRTSPGRAAASGLENLAPQGSAGQPGSGGAT